MVRNLLLSSLLVSSLASAADYKVDKILLNGNSHIPDDSVIYYLGLNIGSEYSKEEIDKMVERAYETGFFKKISISHSTFKNILIIDVVEQPIVSSVKFYGNIKTSDKDLKKLIKLKSGITFSESKLKRDIEAMLKMFQNKGMFNAIVNPKIIENEGGGIDIAFEIKEGKKAVIEKINFIGNGEFSQDELKQQILSNEWIFYRVLSGRYYYDPERLKVDCELLNEFYQASGYPFAKVTDTTAELDGTNEAFNITFTIDSGPKMKFGKVTLNDQLKIEDKKHIYEALNKIKTDKVFNINDIRAAIAEINEILARKGYAFGLVEHFITSDKDIVNVEIKIHPTLKFFVNKINIKHNTRTREEVIRRELRISEKDSYDISKIERSLQRIRNLGYFSDVSFKPKQVNDSDKVDIDIAVEEKRTTNALFNIGYNTAVGPLFGIKYSEINLLGTGRNVSANFQFARLEKAFDLSLNEPYFLGYDITGGANIFYDKRTYDTGAKNNKHRYYVESRGLGLSGTYNLTEYLKHEINYGIKIEEMDYSTDQMFISAYLRPETKLRTVSTIGQSLIYDKTDNSFVPTKGYVVSFSQNFAGIGGDSQYMQNMLMAANYTPVYKDKVIFKVSGQGGVITGFGKNVRPLDNFYSQDRIIRGFEYNGIGPRDARTFDPLGGKTYISGSLELKFPIGLPREIGMNGVAFGDIATLYNIDIPSGIDEKQHPYYNSKTLRASYGLGVIWDAPIGLVRFEYGIPVKKKEYDGVQRFNFSIGRSF
jgi:outer membrane protein insertion porin family